MDSNLFSYIWRHSRKEQIAVLIVVLTSLPFYFLSLNLPKTITNEAIQGQVFDGQGSTASFMNFTFDVPTLLGGLPGETFTLFGGFDLERMSYLMALSLSFLGLVLINGVFKFNINTMKGRMGERMLRRMRFSLFERLLRFPTMHFRKLGSAEAATMIKDEVEPLGGFIGDAFVQPVFLGGQALTAMLFILTQNLLLGSVALGVVLVQSFIIPKLRKRVLNLGKRRQLAARALSGKVGEVVGAMREIRVHDTSNFERADITGRLGKIFHIRYELYQRKFFIKFLNNLLAQMTPFLFYAIGGYFAIKGELDIGQLLAVLVAYKDLPGPIKELIDWDQQRQDVQIKYEQVMEQFMPDGVIDAEIQSPDQPTQAIAGDVVLENVGFEEDTGGIVLESVSTSWPADSHIAFTGTPNSGRDYLSQILARVYTPSTGKVRFNGQNYVDLPEAVTGRRISYVGQDIYLFAQSLRDNLLYGLKHQPLRAPEYSEDEAREFNEFITEAARSGNSALDFNADWVSYEDAGVDGPAEIDRKIVDTLCLVGLEADVYQFGLNGSIDPAENPELAENILSARRSLHDQLSSPEFANLVEPFDPEVYNTNATLAENMLFGTATGKVFSEGNREQNPYLRQILTETGMYDEMLRMGLEIADTMVELFADLPPGHAFFEQFSFISSDELEDYDELLSRVRKEGQDSLGDRDIQMFIRLPARYIENRHRLGLLDENIQAKAMEVRKRFRDNLPDDLAGEIDFYQPEFYNKSATLQDNILLGRIVYGQAEALERVCAVVEKLLDDLGLRNAVLQVGLAFNVGGGGKRLTAAQRQRLGLARALLKDPDILIMDEALAVLDAETVTQLLGRVKTRRAGKGLVWSVERPDMVEEFDEILVFDGGKLCEKGTFEDLMNNGEKLPDLLKSSR